MKRLLPRILTINCGSSTIKIALFEAGQSLAQVVKGKIHGIGKSDASFDIQGRGNAVDSRLVPLPDHSAAVDLLIDWIEENFATGAPLAVGHRIVHGGPHYWEPQAISSELIAVLRKLSQFDPEHLPQAIQVIKALQRRFPNLPQIACFDTAFHHEMPRVARRQAIPRKYEERGMRRYGFHGLSCAFVMEEMARIDGLMAARGRIIIAHLGNGASVTAVLNGKSMDTSMGLTPAAGLPMGTRSGDIDPGLAWYLTQTEGMSAEAFHRMVNHESGLLGMSETTSDMQELSRLEASDMRAAEAIEVFCYQAKKWICAMAGALGGLDMLVFTGGIGEGAPHIRARICDGLGFLGMRLDAAGNDSGATVISTSDSLVLGRIVHTNEELMIAKDTRRVLDLNSEKE